MNIYRKNIVCSLFLTFLFFNFSAKAVPESFANLAEKLMPSVVNISTTQTIKTQSNNRVNLVNCDYFTTNILEINEEQIKDYRNLDSFVVFMCVEGSVDITAGNYSENLKMGETILLPAITEEIKFNSADGKLLEIF